MCSVSAWHGSMGMGRLPTRKRRKKKTPATVTDPSLRWVSNRRRKKRNNYGLCYSITCFSRFDWKTTRRLARGAHRRYAEQWYRCSLRYPTVWVCTTLMMMMMMGRLRFHLEGSWLSPPRLISFFGGVVLHPRAPCAGGKKAQLFFQLLTTLPKPAPSFRVTISHPPIRPRAHKYSRAQFCLRGDRAVTLKAWCHLAFRANGIIINPNQPTHVKLKRWHKHIHTLRNEHNRNHMWNSTWSVVGEVDDTHWCFVN